MPIAPNRNDLCGEPSAPPAARSARPRRGCGRGRARRASGRRREDRRRGGDDVDAGVGIVDPVDRDLVDPQALPLGKHEELGVEEPRLVAHEGQQRARAVGADGLEAALRIREARPQRRAEQDVVARARSARASGRAVRAPRARAGCRSPRRCGRRRAARRAAEGRRVRSTGRRPCRRAHRRRSRTTLRAAPVRGRGGRGVRPRTSGELLREGAGDEPGSVTAAVVRDRDPKRERERRGQVRVEPPDALPRGRAPRRRTGTATSSTGTDSARPISARSGRGSAAATHRTLAEQPEPKLRRC